jgi:hypothetical protein
MLPLLPEGFAERLAMLRLNSLKDDERGAILVVALIMGTVLTGACFHIVDVHLAISHRESAQTAADAVAGESAYWHAQGMNLVAFVNICMAVILSAFVAVRAAELLGVTAAIILAFIPGAQGAAATAGRIAEGAYKIERKITKPIMRSLDFSTKSEHALSAAFPYIALGASVAKDFGNGFAWSPALFPTGPDKFLSRKVAPGGVEMTTFPPRMGAELTRNRAALSTVQKRFPKAGLGGLNLVGSLPVEEEDYYQLCSRASEQLASYFLLDKIPWVKESIGWLGGNLPGLMCQPIGEAKNLIEKQIGKEAKAGANKHCDQEEKDWSDGEVKRREEAQRNKPVCNRVLQSCKDAWQRWRGTYQPPPTPKWDDKKRKDCRKEKEEKLAKEARDKADKLATDNQLQTDSIKTAKLWSLIYADSATEPEVAVQSPFLHVWAHHVEPEVDLTPGWIRLLPGLPTRVEVQTPAVSFEPNASSAKGAVYYHCVEAGNLKLRTCADNAMWNMRWRYKLGVDRDAAVELQNLVGDSIRGYFGYIQGQFYSGVLGKLLAKAGGSKKVDEWNRDSKNPAVKIDTDSIWLRRLTGSVLQRSSGKVHGVFWGAPNGVDLMLGEHGKPVVDFIYLR